MSDGGKTSKPGTTPGNSTPPADVAPTKVFRSLKPGEIGADRMNPVHEERAAAAAQISQTLKAWRAANGAAGGAAIPKGSGSPLPSDVRTRMEPKLGAKLDSVRVHTGGDSAESARGFGARAFTVGEDIHFNAGEFAPGTKEGDRLLAHELTHVVQGQKSGVQRKADDAAGDEKKEAGGGEGDKAGVEVSDPNEQAEKEADATGDQVADEMHGGDEKAEGKDKKDAKSDKEKGKDDKKGGDNAEGGNDKAEAGGDAKPDEKAGDGEAKQGGEKTAPEIGAKLGGVGTKLYRAAAAGAGPAPAPGGGAPGATPGAAPKPDLKSPADVRKFCAPDPIAIQKLDDVDGETNIDPDDGGSGAAKADFYQSVMAYVNANPAAPANTIFNSCFNNAASKWKFKGKKIPPAAITRLCSRSCGLNGWWYTAVDKTKFENEITATLGPGDAGAVSSLALDLFKTRLKNGADVMSSLKRDATIAPSGKSTWFSPDQVKLSTGGDAGFGDLMQSLALQPEWFGEGTINFELSPSAFQGTARKPTAYDGMQSAHWVSRPQGEDTFGVTGGGLKEFIADNVKASGIVSAKAMIPSDDMKQQIQAAIQRARDNALEQDPMLKQAIEKETNKDKKRELEGMLPTLTDQLIRGDLSFGSVPTMVRNICKDVIGSTAGERRQPAANTNPIGTGRRP